MDDLETILLVEDEESVRRTFVEWLQELGVPCHILTAADAEAALRHANSRTIDLAILDWNLGTGSDGLQLLEDLYLFNPDLAAIMVTGYAHQATPLHALRMGVRDYLDKNQDLDRNTFLASVRRQLERIRPARRERRLNQSLKLFRETLEKILPLVESATKFQDPVPLPKAVRAFLHFLKLTTQAKESILVMRSVSTEGGTESQKAFDDQGNELTNLVPFSQSLAGLAMGLQRPLTIHDPAKEASQAALKLQPFEQSRHTMLAIPFSIAPGVQAVLELFRSSTDVCFSEKELNTATAAIHVASELLRQALAERQSRQMLLDAVAAALEASKGVSTVMSEAPAHSQATDALPKQLFDELQQGLRGMSQSPDQSEETLRLTVAIRGLATHHGTEALRHCTRMVEDLRQLLDNVTASGEIHS